MEPIRISIVQDIGEIRDGLKFILHQEPSLALVDAYSNTEDALKGLISHPPDIVIMDINLPDGSGITCMQQVKQKRPNMQFMIFTIYEDSEQIFQSLRWVQAAIF